MWKVNEIKSEMVLCELHFERLNKKTERKRKKEFRYDVVTATATVCYLCCAVLCRMAIMGPWWSLEMNVKNTVGAQCMMCWGRASSVIIYEYMYIFRQSFTWFGIYINIYVCGIVGWSMRNKRLCKCTAGEWIDFFI